MQDSKREVLSFARSFVHNTNYEPDITEAFLQHLKKTGLAAAFYERHRDAIPDSYHEQFKTIHAGIQKQNEIHEQTINTLNDAPISYYLCKEWVAPWPHRYSCDVDILIHPDNLPQLHQYLHDNDYLVDGAEIAHPEPFTEELFKLNTDQTRLREYQRKKQQIYNAIRDETRRRREQAQADLQALRDAEQRFAQNTDIWEEYKRLDDKRDFDDEAELVKINAEIRDLFKQHIAPHPALQPFYHINAAPAFQRYDDTYQQHQPRLTDYASFRGGKHAAQRHVHEGKTNHTYRRNGEFLEVNTRITELGGTGTDTINVRGNTVDPVDTFIHDAAHFVMDMHKLDLTYPDNTLLKYLIDGAMLLKHHDVQPDDIARRAAQFNRSDDVQYYTELLNETGLGHVDVTLDTGLRYTTASILQDETVLFDETTPWLIVLKVIEWLRKQRYLLKRKLTPPYT